MLDLTTLVALLPRSMSSIPKAMYFHENQMTYPWSKTDRDVQLGRDRHYGFINIVSALAADAVYFNSQYHMESFLKAAELTLKGMRDYRELDSIKSLPEKCSVLPLGLDLSQLDPFRIQKKHSTPTVLWNHRWEHDKNPELFFELLEQAKEKGHAFRLNILGESFPSTPQVFEEAESRFKDEIHHFGFLDSFESYAQALWESDIALTTSLHDFFGVSVAEATYCECYPILPYRLAYPEHFEEHSSFYHSPEEALQLFTQALEHFPELPLPRHSFEQYRWETIIPRYDDAMESVRPKL